MDVKSHFDSQSSLHHSISLNPLKYGFSLLVCLGLTACAVGPDFKKPDAPKVGVYTEKPVSSELATAPSIGGTKQTFDPAADIPAEWWSLYRSPN